RCSCLTPLTASLHSCCLFVFSPFSFSLSADHQDLHSFPTRRSSDLLGEIVRGVLIAEVPQTVEPNAGSEAPTQLGLGPTVAPRGDRKSTRLNSSHVKISYAVFCLKKKKKDRENDKVQITRSTLHQRT